jgi:hypothetical protein
LSITRKVVADFSFGHALPYKCLLWKHTEFIEVVLVQIGKWVNACPTFSLGSMGDCPDRFNDIAIESKDLLE